MNFHSMHESHKKILTRNRMMLIRNMCADEIIQYLIEKEILSDQLAEQITTKSTDFEKNILLLTILPKRGRFAYETFKDALRCSNQDHLASNLEKFEFQKNLYTCGTKKSDKPSKHYTLAKRSDASVKLSVFGSLCDVKDGPNRMFVERTTLDFYSNSKHNAYKMTSRPRGYALIVSLRRFVGKGFPDREGSDVDQRNLFSMLQQLDYEVKVEENLSADHIKTEVRQFAQKAEHRFVDSCFVAVLSYGSEGVIYGSDGNTVTTESLLKMFDNINCQQLQNKPKMFLLQTCRSYMTPETIHNTSQSLSRQCNGATSITASDKQLHRQNIHERLPSSSDMIIGYATSPGDVAIRNTQHGSIFIQGFVRAVALHAKDKDIAEILTITNGIVRKKTNEFDSKLSLPSVTPEFHSTLCKKLYFYPGIFSKQSKS